MDSDTDTDSSSVYEREPTPPPIITRYEREQAAVYEAVQYDNAMEAGESPVPPPPALDPPAKISIVPTPVNVWRFEKP